VSLTRRVITSAGSLRWCLQIVLRTQTKAESEKNLEIAQGFLMKGRF
jgi:hypothetical protein